MSNVIFLSNTVLFTVDILKLNFRDVFFVLHPRNSPYASAGDIQPLRQKEDIGQIPPSHFSSPNGLFASYPSFVSLQTFSIPFTSYMQTIAKSGQFHFLFLDSICSFPTDIVRHALSYTENTIPTVSEPSQSPCLQSFPMYSTSMTLLEGSMGEEILFFHFLSSMTPHY